MLKFLYKLKNKKGNTFLFMPFICIFGCMFIYIFMDMGTAYARTIEMQSIADAGCRAGVYGGMNGKYTQYIVERYDGSDFGTLTSSENYHIYVMLDGGTALAVAREIIIRNLNVLSIQTGNDITDVTPGKLYVSNSKIKLSNPDAFFGRSHYHGVYTLPVWQRPSGGGSGQYVPTKINSFANYQEVMKTGNFFVTIEGEYRTIMASEILGRDSIRMSAFASALATAKLK